MCKVHHPSALMWSRGALHTWGQQGTQQSEKLLSLQALHQPPQASPGVDTHKEEKDAWIPVAHVRGSYLQDNNWYTKSFFYFFFFSLFLTWSLFYFLWVGFAPHLLQWKKLLKTFCWVRFTKSVQQYNSTAKHAALSIFKGWASTGDSSGRENISEGKTIWFSDQQKPAPELTDMFALNCWWRGEAFI